MNTSWVNGLIEDNKRVNFLLIINCILISILAFQTNELTKLDIGLMLFSEFVTWAVTFYHEIKYKHISGCHKLFVLMDIAGMPVDKENLFACVKGAKEYTSTNLACAIINILPLTNVLSEALNINSPTGMALTYFTILEIIYISFIYVHWHYICSKYKKYVIKGE